MLRTAENPAKIILTADRSEINANGQDLSFIAVELIDDPWKLWVFRIGAGSEFQKEESQNEYAFDAEIRIEKVTEKWKTE